MLRRAIYNAQRRNAYLMERRCMEQAYFLTVDWCNRGNRGIFCDTEGRGYHKEEEHTKLEMQEILGVFWLILNSKSELLTEEEVAEYTYWYPLEEYSNQFGVALKSERMK